MPKKSRTFGPPQKYPHPGFKIGFFCQFLMLKTTKKKVGVSFSKPHARLTFCEVKNGNFKSRGTPVLFSTIFDVQSAVFKVGVPRFFFDQKIHKILTNFHEIILYNI